MKFPARECYAAAFLLLAMLSLERRAYGDEQQNLVTTSLPPEARWPMVTKFDDAVVWQANQTDGLVAALMADISNSKASKEAAAAARSLEGVNGVGIDAVVREIFACGLDAATQTFCSESVPASSTPAEKLMKGKGWKNCLVSTFWVSSTKFGLSVNASVTAYPPHYASFFPTVFQVAYVVAPDKQILEQITTTTKKKKEIGSRLLNEYWLQGSPAPAVSALREGIAGTRDLIATVINSGLLSDDYKTAVRADKVVGKLPRLSELEKSGVLECDPSTPCVLANLWRMEEERMWYWTQIASNPNSWKLVSERYEHPVN
jgi:hypothetical protein